MHLAGIIIDKFGINTYNKSSVRKQALQILMRLTATDKEAIQKILEHINSDLSQNYPIHSLAQKMNTGSSRFKLMFCAFTGLPVHKYILRQRMALAIELLQQDRLNLKNISKKCGYKHNTNFVAAFKKFYGYTPGQYWKLNN